MLNEKAERFESPSSRPTNNVAAPSPLLFVVVSCGDGLATGYVEKLDALAFIHTTFAECLGNNKKKT